MAVNRRQSEHERGMSREDKARQRWGRRVESKGGGASREVTMALALAPSPRSGQWGVKTGCAQLRQAPDPGLGGPGCDARLKLVVGRLSFTTHPSTRT